MLRDVLCIGFAEEILINLFAMYTLLQTILTWAYVTNLGVLFFQIRQVKKTSVIPKPALRKRRSFKRQASQAGRGKQPVLLQGFLFDFFEALCTSAIIIICCLSVAPCLCGVLEIDRNFVL